MKTAWLSHGCSAALWLN